MTAISQLTTFGLIVAASAGISACGSSGSKKGSGKPEAPPAPAVPRADEVYFLDAASFSDVNSDSEVLWTYDLTVDGESRVAKRDVTIDVLRLDMGAQAIKGSSIVQLDLTLRGKTAAGEQGVLATNNKDEVESNPVQNKIFEDSCSTVSSSVNIWDALTVVDEAGRKLLKITLRLCDFERALVAPTIEIKPQNTEVDLRQIVYQCEATTKTDYTSTNHLFYIYDNWESTCTAAYTLPRTGALLTTQFLQNNQGMTRALAMPAGYVNEPFNIHAANTFIDIVANGGPAKRFSMVQDAFNGDTKLPVGAMRDCHGMEVQALYKDDESTAAGTVKEARFSYKRSFDAHKNALVWVSDDQTAMPTTGAIVAAGQRTTKYWLMCTWQNPLGGTIATIAPRSPT